MAEPSGESRSRSARTGAAAAWTACALTTALRVVVIWVCIRAGDDHLPIGYGVWIETSIAGGIFGTAASIVGAVIVSRQPRNAIGWLLVIGGVIQVVVAASLYIPAVVLAHGSSDVALFFAWLSGPLIQASFGLAAVGLLLFPDGRPPSSRWLAVVVLAAAGMVTRFLAVGFLPQYLFSLPTVANPYQLHGSLATTLTAVPGIGLLVGVTAAILAAIALLRRYAGADPTLRRQLLWFTWAGLVVTVLSLPVVRSFVLEAGASRNGAWASVWVVGLSLLPIAAGIAILRYRLYEIDRIVNRTLVYGALTAILAGIFTAGISLAQRVFVALTGQTSDVAIVLATLFAATAYAPVRKRLEALVDRYFKYAERGFGAYRSELDLIRSLLDPEQAAGRLLRESMSELGAAAGALELDRGNDRDGVLLTAGRWIPGSAVVSVSIGPADRSIGRLMLAGRSSGGSYSEREIEAMRAAASLLGETLVGVGTVSAGRASQR